MRFPRSRGVMVAGWIVVALVGVATAAPPELRRDLDSYFLLAVRLARLQDFTLPSACNVGVNCARPASGGGRCGRLVLGRGAYADGSQVAADEVRCTKAGLSLWQLFTNGGSCGDATIRLFPPQPFFPPIIPGTCDADCAPDVGALKAQCGFPEPFPACDPGRPIDVRPGEDCDASDAQPGNGQCDLAPGSYGAVRVANGGHLVLADGLYAMCGLLIGRRAEVSTAATTIAIPASYDLRVGNGSRLGFTCGEAALQLDGAGAAAIGRQTSVAARVCAPERQVRIGGGTSLSGRVVGDTVVTGRDITGVCCCSDPCD